MGSLFVIVSIALEVLALRAAYPNISLPRVPSVPPPISKAIPTPPIEPLPAPPVPKHREFLFKFSPYLTPSRKARITNDLEKFATYLEALGLTLPQSTPAIEVSEQGGGVGSGAAHFDDVKIEAKRVDDPKAATEAFAIWVVTELVPFNFPQSTMNLQEIQEDSMMREGQYREAWEKDLFIYLNDSLLERSVIHQTHQNVPRIKCTMGH